MCVNTFISWGSALMGILTCMSVFIDSLPNHYFDFAFQSSSRYNPSYRLTRKASSYCSRQYYYRRDFKRPDIVHTLQNVTRISISSWRSCWDPDCLLASQQPVPANKEHTPHTNLDQILINSRQPPASIQCYIGLRPKGQRSYPMNLASRCRFSIVCKNQ